MFKDENRHYSLRKLSVGLASVLIGISFASSMDSNSVKADTVNSGSNGDQTVIKGSNVAIKGNDATVKTDAKFAPKGQSQTPETVKKDSGAITQDIKQNAVNTKAKQQNITVQGNDAVSDKALKVADSSETTLNLKGTKIIDPKTLKENKTETIVKADPARGIDPVKFASNGGFDPKIWGTMDTSKWQLDDNGNITGYTGDMSHIIIPNASDFAKDGKSYQQIGISSDEMQKLGGESNSKANTLAISLTDNRKVKASDTDWRYAFYRSTLKQANLEGLDTSNVTYMYSMFDGASRLTSLDVSNWDTSKVADMSGMFAGARSLKSLDVSKWKTSKVTDMSWMFNGASKLTNLDVSKWDTSNVTNMSMMFSSDPKLALIVNGDKFADYLMKNNFAGSNIDSGVKSVTTDNTKLLQLLTNDSQHDSATRTIVFTFPVNYSLDLAKYHLTKNGNTYQIKQSADYDKPYLQGTVLINAIYDITEHHIDTTKPYTLSDTWQPNYDKLVLAHKNDDGTVSFDKVQLPKVPGYKAKVARNNGLLLVSYLALAPEKPKIDTALNELQFSNKLATNNAVESNLIVESNMYKVVNDDHNWQLPVIKSYELKFVTNKNQITFAYTKDKQYDYRFVLTFKDGQYHLATFDKENKLLKTYSIKSYEKLTKIIDSLVLMNIA